MAAVEGDLEMEVSPESSVMSGSGVKCPDCDKLFTRASSLVAHRRLHTGERPYACSVCDRAFSDKSNLRSHIKIHTVTEKLFTCEICSKSFAMKRYLHKHRQTHSEWNPCIPSCATTAVGNNSAGKGTAIDGPQRTNRKEIIVLPPHKLIKCDTNIDVGKYIGKVSAPLVNVKVQTPTQPIFIQNKSPKQNPVTVAYSCKIIKQRMPDGSIAHFMDDGHKLIPVALVSVDNNMQQAVFKPISVAVQNVPVSKNNLVFELNNPQTRTASENTGDVSESQMKEINMEHVSGDEQTDSSALTEVTCSVSNPKFQSIDSQTDIDNGNTTFGTILSKVKQHLVKIVPTPTTTIDSTHTILLNSNSQNLSFAGISTARSQALLENENSRTPERHIPSLSELALARVTPVVQNIQLNTNSALPGVSVPFPAGSLQALMKMLSAKHDEPTMTSIQTVDTDPLHDDVNVVSEQVDDSPESVMDSDEEGQLIIKQEIPEDDDDEHGGMHMLNSGNENGTILQGPPSFAEPEPVTAVEHALETVVFPVGMEIPYHQGTSDHEIKVTEIQLGNIGASGDATVGSKQELIHCDEALLAKLLAGNINPADIVIVYPEMSDG